MLLAGQVNAVFWVPTLFSSNLFGIYRFLHPLLGFLQILEKFGKLWSHYSIAEKIIIAKQFWYSRNSHYAYSKNNTLAVELEKIDHLNIFCYDKLSQNNLLSNRTAEKKFTL